MRAPTLSYWEQEHWLKGIDFLIVGSGLTGLQTALGLKKKNPKAKVVVVDRFAWSQGASLKNAGFACFANMGELLDDFKQLPEHEVFQLVKRRYQGLEALRAEFGDSAIGYESRGSREVFNQANEQSLSDAIDRMQFVNSVLEEELGLERVFEFSSKAPDGFKGSISNRYEGQLNTGALYSSLWQSCQQAGITLFGGLALERFEAGSSVLAVFNELAISCQHLIICTNGFANKLADIEVVPARGQVLVTELLDQPPQGLHMYDRGYYYWRDIDGRILLGGARHIDMKGEEATELSGNQNVVDELQRFLFEDILGHEVAIDHQWSGIMGMSPQQDKRPIIKKLDENVYCAVRLGGMGVALSALVASETVALIES